MYDQVQPALIDVKIRALRSLGYNIGYVCVPFQVCRIEKYKCLGVLQIFAEDTGTSS
jgi:hypothetical protein